MHASMYWVLLLFLQVFVSCITIQEDANDQNDFTLENFMLEALVNYSDWLQLKDPLPPIKETINLRSDKQLDYGVDANFSITNQYMSGHANMTSFIPSSKSNISEKVLAVSWAPSFDTPFSYGGNYTVSGTILASGSSQEEMSFCGSGNWTLRTNGSFEYVRFTNYNISSEGYIDLDYSLANSYEYIVKLRWVETEFEGLESPCRNVNVDIKNKSFHLMVEDELNKIQRAFEGVYTRFLNSSFAPEFSFEVIPPQRLLVTYLKEVFSKTKFAEIISLWTPPPTSTTVSPSEQNGGSMILFEMKQLYSAVSIGIILMILK